MSEENNENNENEETNFEEVEQDTSADSEDETPVAQVAGLQATDLRLMASILEVMSSRGAVRANEMQAVGALYQKLLAFLIANGIIQVPGQATEVSTDEPSTDDAGADSDVTESEVSAEEEE